MSLRTKYLIAAALSVLLPFLAYLLLDAKIIRSGLVQDHLASQRLAAELLQSALDVCEADCTRGAQRILTGFAASNPDLDVMLLDGRFKARATSRPASLGQTWKEEGIGRVLRGETSLVWAISRHGDEPVLDVTVPWRSRAGAIQGAVHISRSLKQVDERVTRTWLRHAAFVGVVALLVGLVLGIVVYRTVIGRLARLDAELWRLHAPHGERAHEREQGRDEIDRLSAGLRCLVGDLAASVEEKGKLLCHVEQFNEKLAAEVERTRQELLAVQEELLRAEQVATMGKLAAGLAHELRNPLFIIRGSAEAFRRRHPAEATAASDIIEEVDRLDSIIARLMDLARPLSLASAPVDLADLLRDIVAEAAKSEPRGRRARVLCTGEPDRRASGDRDYLRQALTHLVDNARQAAGADGEVRLSVQRGEAGWLLVNVEDTGGGIAPEDLPSVFDPFFSRRAGGTGLGLSAAKKIVDLHGGSIAVESEPGKGTRFTVRLKEVHEERTV